MIRACQFLCVPDADVASRPNKGNEQDSRAASPPQVVKASREGDSASAQSKGCHGDGGDDDPVIDAAEVFHSAATTACLASLGWNVSRIYQLATTSSLLPISAHPAVTVATVASTALAVHGSAVLCNLIAAAEKAEESAADDVDEENQQDANVDGRCASSSSSSSSAQSAASQPTSKRIKLSRASSGGKTNTSKSQADKNFAWDAVSFQEILGERFGVLEYAALFYLIAGTLPASWHAWAFASSNTLLPTGGNLVLPFQLFLPGLIGSAAMFERWHRKVLFPEAEEGWCDVERSLPPDKQPRHPHSGAPALGAPTGNAQHSDINSQHFQVHSGTVETDEDPKPSQTDSSGCPANAKEPPADGDGDDSTNTVKFKLSTRADNAAEADSTTSTTAGEADNSMSASTAPSKESSQLIGTPSKVSSSSGDEVLPPGTELGAPEKQSVAEEHRMSVAETIEWANRHISAYLTTESGATHFVAFQSLAMAFDLFVDYSMTQWRGAFFDTFQSKNVAKFKDLLQSFGVIATSNVIASAYSDYMTGLWDLHSRGYLVREFSANAYFKNAAFYKMTVTNAELRNCDQRLHEDVQAFVSGSRRLTLGLADAVLRLLFFFPQLVYHSPPGLWELCVVMAIVSSVTTHHLGKDLMPANMAIQNAEAGFRDSLISVRERSEPLALQGNDDAGLLQRRFRDIKIALWNSMQVGFRLQAFTSGYGLCAGVVPFLLLAPSYFNGAITMGAMFQLESIIGQVQGSLDFFMSTYADFASWRVTTDRLIALEDFTEKAGVAAALRLRGTGGGTTLAITDGGAVDAAGCGGGGDSHGGRVADEVENSGTGLDVYFDEIRFRDAASSSALEDDSTSSLPLHLSALRNVHFTLHAGDKRLILGDAAAGKSVFVRCLAGIWPDKWMGPKTEYRTRPKSLHFVSEMSCVIATMGTNHLTLFEALTMGVGQRSAGEPTCGSPAESWIQKDIAFVEDIVGELEAKQEYRDRKNSRQLDDAPLASPARDDHSAHSRVGEEVEVVVATTAPLRTAPPEETSQTHLERCAATALLDAGLPDWVAGLHERHFDAHVSTEVRGRLVFAQLYLLTEFRKFFVVDDFPTKQNLSDTVTASLTKKFLEKLDSATHGAVFFGRPRNVAMKEVFSEVIKGARAERLDALSGSAARNL